MRKRTVQLVQSRVRAVQRGIRVRCRVRRGTLVCMPGHECKPITSILGRVNGLGDETSTGAQRAASDAKKVEWGQGVLEDVPCIPDSEI